MNCRVAAPACLQKRAHEKDERGEVMNGTVDQQEMDEQSDGLDVCSNMCVYNNLMDIMCTASG